MAAGVNFIRLATPTTDEKRLPDVLNNTSGFVYYVSITGITGSAPPQQKAVADNIARLKKHTDLPICVGFGIRTPDQAAAMAAIADGVVVGSALVDVIGETAENSAQTVDKLLALASALAEGVKRT